MSIVSCKAYNGQKYNMVDDMELDGFYKAGCTRHRTHSFISEIYHFVKLQLRKGLWVKGIWEKTQSLKIHKKLESFERF